MSSTRLASVNILSENKLQTLQLSDKLFWWIIQKGARRTAKNIWGGAGGGVALFPHAML